MQASKEKPLQSIFISRRCFFIKQLVFSEDSINLICFNNWEEKKSEEYCLKQTPYRNCCWSTQKIVQTNPPIEKKIWAFGKRGPGLKRKKK